MCVYAATYLFILTDFHVGTLNPHQMKLQEAKFEMITSEASYLNSLNVLVDHFIPHIGKCDYITWEEKMILFDKIEPGNLILVFSFPFSPICLPCSEKVLRKASFGYGKMLAR